MIWIVVTVKRRRLFISIVPLIPNRICRPAPESEKRQYGYSKHNLHKGEEDQSLLPRCCFHRRQSYVYREVGCWYNRKERLVWSSPKRL